MFGRIDWLAQTLRHEAEIVFSEARHSWILAGNVGKCLAGIPVQFELILADGNVVVDGGTGSTRVPGCLEEAERSRVIATLERRIAVHPLVGMRMHDNE